MKTLTRSQPDVRIRGASVGVAFTSRFITRNLHVLNAALKAARMSLQRGKNVPIHTHAEFRRAIAVKQ